MEELLEVAQTRSTNLVGQDLRITRVGQIVLARLSRHPFVPTGLVGEGLPMLSCCHAIRLFEFLSVIFFIWQSLSFSLFCCFLLPMKSFGIVYFLFLCKKKYC